MAQSPHLTTVGGSVGHFIDTLLALVGREFRMRYKGSFFGLLWAVINPLGTVVIIWFLFTKILVIPVFKFPVFLYSAMLPWTWFAMSVQTGASTLIENRALVRTPFFAKPLLPWTVTCTSFVLYLLALPVLFGLMFFERVPVTQALAVLPVIWIVQWVFTLAFTVLIAAVGVLIRDVQHLMVILLMFWFYLTPIFYELKQVPAPIARWFAYNPMTAIINAHRAVTLYGQYPDWIALGSVAALGGGLLVVSLLLFRSLEDAFIEEA
jgi:ABC-type polysaccharide/polyol phosphate export permease